MLFDLAKSGMSENIDLSIFVYDLAILHPELQDHVFHNNNIVNNQIKLKIFFLVYL